MKTSELKIGTEVKVCGQWVKVVKLERHAMSKSTKVYFSTGRFLLISDSSEKTFIVK